VSSLLPRTIDGHGTYRFPLFLLESLRSSATLPSPSSSEPRLPFSSEGAPWKSCVSILGSPSFVEPSNFHRISYNYWDSASLSLADVVSLPLPSGLIVTRLASCPYRGRVFKRF